MTRLCPHCERHVGPRHFYTSGKTRCQNRRTWTPAKRFRLMTLIEQGKPDDEIAAAFGVSTEAVQLARKRYGIPSHTTMTLNTRKVARMLGVPCSKTIAWWIEQGWLRGRQTRPRGGSRQWMIRERDLWVFLENPDTWHLWEPERITDPRLRERMLRLREGVRFLTAREAADRYFVEPKTVYQWERKGWIRGIRRGNGNRVYRADELEAMQWRRARYTGIAA